MPAAMQRCYSEHAIPGAMCCLGLFCQSLKNAMRESSWHLMNGQAVEVAPRNSPKGQMGFQERPLNSFKNMEIDLFDLRASVFDVHVFMGIWSIECQWSDKFIRFRGKLAISTMVKWLSSCILAWESTHSVLISHHGILPQLRVFHSV